MPEYMCVQCFSCETYQVQQVKKANKFQCKMCGEKQSVQKIFAVSDKAKDVRLVVQERNMKRSEEGQSVQENGNVDNSACDDFRSETVRREVNWDEFTTQVEDCAVEKEDGVGDDQEKYVTSVPERKRKATRENNSPSSRSKKNKTAARTLVSARTPPLCRNEAGERDGSGSIPNVSPAARREAGGVKVLSERCGVEGSPSQRLARLEDTPTEPHVIDAKSKHDIAVNESADADSGSKWASFLEGGQDAAGEAGCGTKWGAFVEEGEQDAADEAGCGTKWGAFVEDDGVETGLSGGKWGGHDDVENREDSSVFVTTLD
ncbi:hypothetical protein BSKO_01179 [Bryopsis sp. KO-2023]|nr:hypothetical protein BSKO_01179 [Bryopsis sp. KO-2023]